MDFIGTYPQIRALVCNGEYANFLLAQALAKSVGSSWDAALSEWWSFLMRWKPHIPEPEQIWAEFQAALVDRRFVGHFQNTLRLPLLWELWAGRWNNIQLEAAGFERLDLLYKTTAANSLWLRWNSAERLALQIEWLSGFEKVFIRAPRAEVIFSGDWSNIGVLRRLHLITCLRLSVGQGFERAPLQLFSIAIGEAEPTLTQTSWWRALCAMPSLGFVHLQLRKSDVLDKELESLGENVHFLGLYSNLGDFQRLPNHWPKGLQTLELHRLDGAMELPPALLGLSGLTVRECPAFFITHQAAQLTHIRRISLSQIAEQPNDPQPNGLTAKETLCRACPDAVVF